MTGKILWGIFMAGVAMVIYSAAAPPPIDMFAHTGAAGEATCVSCHNTYAENSGGGQFKITATPPFNNGHYVPGTTYQVTVVFTQPPITSYQCSTEIVDSLGNNMGTLIITDSLYTSIQTATTGRNCVWGGWYATDTFLCRFKWTAPQSGTLGVYATGVVHSGPVGGTGGYAYAD